MNEVNEHGRVRFGNATIEYAVSRSRRRKKTVEITLDGNAGVRVAAPVDLPAGEIRGIVRKRAPWILRKASDAVLQASPRRFVSGETLPYVGRNVRLVVEPGDTRKARVAFDHWSLRISVPRSLSGEGRREAIRKALVAWYRVRATERLTSRTHRWASLLGCQPSGVLIRDQRQRWASCGPDGTLRFNWRIVMAEPALIDYVVVHELVHLTVRDHSPRFWAEVARAIPDYQRSRQRLKEVGPRLAL